MATGFYTGGDAEFLSATHSWGIKNGRIVETSETPNALSTHPITARSTARCE